MDKFAHKSCVERLVPVCPFYRSIWLRILASYWVEIEFESPLAFVRIPLHVPDVVVVTRGTDPKLILNIWFTVQESLASYKFTCLRIEFDFDNLEFLFFQRQVQIRHFSRDPLRLM